MAWPTEIRPCLRRVLRVRIEVQKPHRVGYGSAALSDPLGDLFLGMAKIAVKPRVGPGLFDRIEVFALEIFNQCQFKHLPVACQADDGRGIREAKLARRTPPAFARDQLVLVVDPSDDERLNDPALANAFHELLQKLASKFPPRLKGLGVIWSRGST